MPETPNRVPDQREQQNAETVEKTDVEEQKSSEEIAEERQAVAKENREREAEDRRAEEPRLREIVEELVSGTEIVRKAEGRMSGDSREISVHATKTIGENLTEQLGKGFFSWAKHASIAWKEYQNELRTKTGMNMESMSNPSSVADNFENEVKMYVDRAAGSMAATVDGFLHQKNGVQTEKYEHEKIWEEKRQMAQREFEAKNPAEIGAIREWFGVMHDYFLREEKNGRSMQANVDPEKEEKARQIQEQIDAKGGGGLSEWLRGLQAENLLADIKDSQFRDGSLLKVFVLDGDGKEIVTKDDVLKAENALTLRMEPTEDLNAQKLVNALNSSGELPSASVDADGNLVFDSALTLDQSRRMFQLFRKSGGVRSASSSLAVEK